jgi:hypothetical protein
MCFKQYLSIWNQLCLLNKRRRGLAVLLNYFCLYLLYVGMALMNITWYISTKLNMDVKEFIMLYLCVICKYIYDYNEFITSNELTFLLRKSYPYYMMRYNFYLILIWVNIIHLLHAGEGNMKIYSPTSIIFPPRAIYSPRVSYSLVGE